MTNMNAPDLEKYNSHENFVNKMKQQCHKNNKFDKNVNNLNYNKYH